MKRIFVCSRLRGDLYINQKRAEQYCHYVTTKHHNTAFAPHIHFTRFLDDNIEAERDIGIKAGAPWLLVSDEVWVFVVDGVISTGMKNEIELAITSNTPVRYFAVEFENGLLRNITHLAHLPEDILPKQEQLLAPAVAARRAQATFKAMEARLKAGDLYEDHEEDLDALLGTELAPRDRAIEAAWEGALKE